MHVCPVWLQFFHQTNSQTPDRTYDNHRCLLRWFTVSTISNLSLKHSNSQDFLAIQKILIAFQIKFNPSGIQLRDFLEFSLRYFNYLKLHVHKLTTSCEWQTLGQGKWKVNGHWKKQEQKLNFRANVINGWYSAPSSPSFTTTNQHIINCQYIIIWHYSVVIQMVATKHIINKKIECNSIYNISIMWQFTSLLYKLEHQVKVKFAMYYKGWKWSTKCR